MSDVLRMQLDIQNNLEKDLEKSTKKMKGFNSLIEDAASKFENVGKTITKFVIGGLKSMGRVISQIIPGFAALFSVSTIIDAVRGVLEMNKSLTQLSHRMGHGAQGARVLQQTVYNVNAELGIGVEKAEELVSTLTTMRVPLDMMEGMTRTTGLFAELTGLSADRAAELGGNLVTIGRMGQEAVDGIMASMVGVQRAVGLTESEMNSLSDTIGSSTQMLNQMGKTAGEIEQYNRGVVKLAAAFASVGVEAGKVLSIMDDLLDPGEVEKHAFLLSQLGVSLGDAFEGNIDPAQLVSGFRDLGQTLSGMTGPAAAAMADQLGMSVRDLRQMAELGDDQLASVANAMADGASGAEAMAAAFNEEATGMQKFERAMEKIKGFIGETAMKFMPVIESLFGWIAENAEKFTGWVSTAIDWFMKLPNIVKMAIPLLIAGVILFFRFMRRRFATTATDASKSLETGVAEGITQGSRKGALAMRQEFANAKEIDLRVRTEKGAGFQGMMADAELMEIRASSMGGAFGNVMRRTAEIHRNLAMSTKPLSASSEKLKSMSETNRQNLEISKNERKMIEGAFKVREQSLKADSRSLQPRLAYLKAQERSGKLTGEEAYQMGVIEKRINRNRQLREAGNKRQNDFILFNAREQDRLMKRLSDEQIINLGIEQQERRRNAEQQKANLSDQLSKETERMNLLKLAQEDLDNQLNAGNISVAEKVRLQDEIAIKQKEQQEVLSGINAGLMEQEGILSDVDARLTSITTESGRRGLGLVEGAKAIEGTVSVFGRISDIARTAGRNLTTSVTGAVDRFATGARAAAGAFADRFRKENIGATLRGGARAVGRGAAAAGRGAAGAMGGIMKVLGPIGMLVGILTRLEPVQEMLRQVMEKLRAPLQSLAERLMPIIQNVIDMLMPIIDNLVEAIMPLVDILITTLVPIIQRILNVLGPLFNTLVRALGPILESLFSALMPLIEVLLPPLLWALGALIEVLGRAVGIWGRLLKFILELPERITHALPRTLGGNGGRGTFEASSELQANAFYRVADSVANMGDQLSEAGKAMRETAFDPSSPDTASAFTDSVAEGTARGSAQAEIRRTWEPAQLRALRDGIQQEQAMTEVISGGSNEDRIANNSDRQVELLEAEVTELRRQNELLEQQTRMEEQNHEEEIAVVRRQQREAGNFGGYSASLR